MKKLAVIVPCYNEEAVIEESYRRTKEVLVKLPNPTEIIYINDGSQDKTRSLLDHIAATDPHVKVIHFSRNFGHQPAVTAGINNCDADLAIIIDADMQDPPELIRICWKCRRERMLTWFIASVSHGKGRVFSSCSPPRLFTG